MKLFTIIKMSLFKSKLCYFLLSCVLISSCKEPEPRKPVSVKTGTFLEQSVERNKEILAHERKLIKKIIKEDTLHTYHTPNNIYWYYYNVKDSAQTYRLKENDVVLMSYNIRSFNNDTLYSFKDIGENEFVIDKEDYFPGLRTGIKLLKEGESATFLFPSSLAYGFYGDKNKIGTNQPLISTIKIIDIIEISKDSLK